MELLLQKEYLGISEISSIYFGGGTPSMIPSHGIQGILNEIRSHYTVSPDAEITLEANPDDLTNDYLNELYAAGINRLSIGIQSFHSDDLTWLNRVHTGEHAENCIKLALDAGFENLSIDLIYGIPGLTEKKWSENLEKILKYNIRHISAYWLTVESKTALDTLIRKNKVEAPTEESGINHFRYLRRWAQENHFEHYEISNFCKTGFQAKHNTSYWTGQPYLGLGPSAHSYNGISRQWNIANLEAYRNSIISGKLNFEKEILSEIQFFNEYVMTSLRTTKGCDSSVILQKFGEIFYHQFIDLTEFYVSEELLKVAEGIYYLTEQGMLLADHITADLFQTDDEEAE